MQQPVPLPLPVHSLRSMAACSSSPPARSSSPLRDGGAETLSYAGARREEWQRINTIWRETPSAPHTFIPRKTGRVKLNQKGKSEIIRRVDREDQCGGRQCHSGWKSEEDHIRLAKEIKRNLFSAKPCASPKENGEAKDLTNLDSAWFQLEGVLRRMSGLNFADQPIQGANSELFEGGRCRGHLAMIEEVLGDRSVVRSIPFSTTHGDRFLSRSESGYPNPPCWG